MSERDVAAKADTVHEALAGRESILITLSGGVDSSVAAALAHEAFGDSAVACIVKSETLPGTELDDVKRVAGEIGIGHLTAEFSGLDNPGFVANDDDRCYHHQTMRLGRMYGAARDRGIEAVCDGTNASDPDEGYRPGLHAVEKLEALSPLLARGIMKEGARAIANDYDPSVADKPSMARPPLRIPTDLEVAEEQPSWIERVEMILRTWGFEQFRVRNHDGLARIKVASKKLGRILGADFVRATRDHLKDAGFDHATFDLHGYRTGNVNPRAEAGADAGADDDDLFVDDVFAQGYSMQK